MNDDKIKPFLRWIGGKTKLTSQLISFVPNKCLNNTYFEPFLGSGSLYFALLPKKAVLSDINEQLIECYKSIRNNPRLIYKYLLDFKNNNSEDYYYKIRNEYNKKMLSTKQSARFIFLNKTSYNGIYRVNKNNEFNVPFGKIIKPSLPSLSHLFLISKVLRNTKLIAGNYISILNLINKNDFIYLDPPYPPLSNSAYFTHYSIDKFTEYNQIELSKNLNKLNKSVGCKIMISNADTPLIRNLYKLWNITELTTTRWVSCKSKRLKMRELVITNYDIF